MKWVMMLVLLFVIGCGDTVEQNESDGETTNEPTINPAAQDDSCFHFGELDQYEDTERNETLNIALNGNRGIDSPRCDIDGFGATGEQCDHLENREGYSTKHPACYTPEEIYDAYEEFGEPLNRTFDTPCMWLVSATRGDDGYCSYIALCVTEEQWPEFDWHRSWDETIDEYC